MEQPPAIEVVITAIRAMRATVPATATGQTPHATPKAASGPEGRSYGNGSAVSCARRDARGRGPCRRRQLGRCRRRGSSSTLVRQSDDAVIGYQQPRIGELPSGVARDEQNTEPELDAIGKT